jgi:hypothetical protein
LTFAIALEEPAQDREPIGPASERQTPQSARWGRSSG